ncbi:MAG: hypothetical protein Q8K78_10750 [Planctomycetaceae bacterium]|nr:hypothetical protein [Planctomycetaceae bacterium]
MHAHFDCPKCLKNDDVEVGSTTSTIACRHCGWTKAVEQRDYSADSPHRCLICGCDDLWRQKDFPPQLGLAIVAAGIISSTIAVAYMQPTVALGILMVFALADMALFAVMSDALVCYRCHARYRGAVIGENHPKFDLELNERYRQEAARMQKIPGQATPR